MQYATGPWVLPPELPDDPKKLCLVELFFERDKVTSYYVMRYLRGNWQFQDRLRISPGQKVVRWAYIHMVPNGPAQV